MANLFKVVIFFLSLVGVYFLVPPIRQSVDYYIQKPSFKSDVYVPTAQVLNAVLPDKLQLPTNSEVLGAVTPDTTSSSPLNSFTDEMVKKASSIASDQIESLKTTTTQAFCQAMIEKIKKDCGLDIAK